MNNFREVVEREYVDLSSIYLNAAYFGPSPKRCKILIEKSIKHELDPSYAAYEDWYYRPEKSREMYAKLIGTDSDNIFHACSVSDINNLLIQSLSDSPQHVVVIEKDYPSNVLPFLLSSERKSNVKLTRLDLGNEILPSPDWLKNHLPKDTSIFCCSWVTFDTGKKVDILNIGKILKDRNITFVVDVTQGFGGLSLSSEELSVIDAISNASYKWLLGPYGHAFGYISPELQRRLKHPNANWLTSKNSKVVNSLLEYTTDTLPGARRFDRGQTANLLTISCLEGALDFLSEVGLKNIQDHNKSLSKFFFNNYSKTKYDLITPENQNANIVCLKGKSIDSHNLEKDLRDSNIDVSIREGNIRVSFHVYNSLKHVEHILKILDAQNP